MADNAWQWQEKGTPWKGVGIYHITLVVPNREPLLGTLVVPEDDPRQAYIRRTELGERLVEVLLNHPSYYPEIRVIQFCLMPDHLHAIIYVTQKMEQSFNMVVRSLWQGAKKIGRAYSLSVCPESYSGLSDADAIANASPIFTERPFIRPLSRHGQLQTMISYVKMNPQRLATKRLLPGFFRVQKGIELVGKKYSGVGNIALLQAEHFLPVHVRRVMIDAAQQGDAEPLRNYMNGCVLAARKGSVLVSPFISSKEKEVLNVLIKEGHSIIYLADNGFVEYFKPSGSLFNAVAMGRMLILSPWEYDEHKRHITREECVALNGMAEEICSIGNVPE